MALVAGLAALSCGKEAGKELPAPQQAEDLITIRAVMPDAATKAGAHVGFSWYWSAGDKLAVTGAEETQIYTIKDGFSSKYAEFTGRPVAGENFTISFPENAASTDWSKQTQVGNGGVDHLKYTAELAGVDDYLSFSFTPEWAQEHGGSIRQSGVLKMVIALPDTVTAVKGVSLAAEEELFFRGNGDTKVKKLDLTVEDAEPDAQHTFTAWLTTSWNEVTVPEGTVLVVSVKTAGTTIEKEVTFSHDAVLMTGVVNVFNVDATGWVLPSHYASGKGTEAKPWVIMTPEQIQYMYDDMADGETRYFKLGADIDMTGISWKPLNAEGSFEKRIDFDGDGHTLSNFSIVSTADAPISYASFFGVLYGKCYNVKFVNASVVATKDGAGILGGYCGTAGKPGEVSHVSVQGSIKGAGKIGGLFGNVREATITACSAEVDIDATGQNVGGIFGIDAGIVTVSDCWTAGTIVSASSLVGGIGGDMKTTGSSIYNCYSTASVTTQYLFGGIVGRAVAGQKSNANNCNTQDPQNHIEYCIAWNTLLASNNTDTSEHYSSGTVIGATAIKNFLVGCVRKADIDFQDCPGNAAKGSDYTPFDQEDANPDTPLVKGPGTYAFAYHGKASAAGETLSQVAQRLGWSADVWDFSGDTPKLK